MGFARWMSWAGWEVDKLRKQQLRLQTHAPQGKYQRLADGTWGYPTQPQVESSQAAYQRGWREGWTAGYEASQKSPA